MHSKVRPMLAVMALIVTLLYGLTAQPAYAAPAPQQTEPVYALPGQLRRAQGQPFDTYLVANDGSLFGLTGETPEIEDQIVALRESGPGTEVKVWGTLYPDGRSSDVAEIVVSSIQAAAAPGQTPTPVPSTATVTVIYESVNVRAGPATGYRAIGVRSLNDTCQIVGRNTTSTWWQVKCPDGTIGWISDTVVEVSGDTSSVPVITAIPPPPPATATPVPPPPVPVAPSTAVPPPVPSTPPTNSWQATYFNNTDLTGEPVLVRNEARGQYPLDYNWGNGSPAPGVVNNDYFSARWEGYFYFESGDFTFQVNVDDGARLYLDRIQVVNAWSDGYKEVSNGFNGIGAGNHLITVEYYERTGGAAVRAWWWRTNTTGGGGSSGGGRSRDE